MVSCERERRLRRERERRLRRERERRLRRERIGSSHRETEQRRRTEKRNLCSSLFLCVRSDPFPPFTATSVALLPHPEVLRLCVSVDERHLRRSSTVFVEIRGL